MLFVDATQLEVRKDPVRGLDLNEWGGKDEIALRGRDKIEKRVLPGTFDEAGWVMKLFHR
jgi:hypothetical protein